MKEILKKHEIGFAALGGLGEVGKNTYVYEIDQKIFIVDAGILFPDEHLLGIDYVIPDYQYLVENRERIVGLFITHGHEDHIGGLPYLLKKLNIPKIYAAGFAVSLIKHKLSEHKDVKAPPIIVYKADSVFSFNETTISFIMLNHSIPDMFGILFKTKQGRIFHTGDFKIDFTPVGPGAEYNKLAELGQNGLLCLVSDSTNAEQPGIIKSESVIGKSINALFGNIKGRIIIATFASNIYRIQQIIEASVKSNRKIAVFGRSMDRAIEVGQETGYIHAPKNTFITPQQINRHPAGSITLLCTGSQGEPLAALSRIANGSHRQIQAIPGDTVIFSSSPIPGNQEGVNRTINQLYRLGSEVITHGPLADTHTSGHASQYDLKLILSLTKPKYFIPHHGEHRMLKHHKRLAMDCGVPEKNILVLDNGDVAALASNSIRLAGKIQAGDVYIDGTGIGDIGSSVIRERKLLSEEGMFSVTITIDWKKRELINNPTIISRGFIYMKGSEEFTNKLSILVTTIVNREVKKQPQVTDGQLKHTIISGLSEAILTETLRRPMVIPIIINA